MSQPQPKPNIEESDSKNNDVVELPPESYLMRMLHMTSGKDGFLPYVGNVVGLCCDTPLGVSKEVIKEDE